MTRARLLPRPGFTLVELLVVLGLILVLLGLTLAVNSSGITDSYKTVGAADRVSGWLLIAKSKAQREKRPAGVRFLVVNNQIREAEFIEVPDAYAPPRDPGSPNTVPKLLVSWVSGSTPRLFITGTANTLSDLTTSVFPGDLLSIPELQLLLTVGQFSPNIAPFTTLTLANGNTVLATEINLRVPPNGNGAAVLAKALEPEPGVTFPKTPPGPPTPTYATTTFGFHRQAQPSIGEPTLQLTGDMIIDPLISKANVSVGQIDVLFAANGEVMNASSGSTIFWVRDVRLTTPRPNGPAGPDNRTDYEAAGQMALIVVYTKTGAIATQPVALPTADGVAGFNPFTTTTDAVNTGL